MHTKKDFEKIQQKWQMIENKEHIRIKENKEVTMYYKEAGNKEYKRIRNQESNMTCEYEVIGTKKRNNMVMLLREHEIKDVEDDQQNEENAEFPQEIIIVI